MAMVERVRMEITPMEPQDRRKCFPTSFERVPELRYIHNNEDLKFVYFKSYISYTKFKATTTPLRQLTLTDLSKLYLHEIAYGKCLYLRTIERAKGNGGLGVMTIVEDHVGNAVIFCANNFTDSLSRDVSGVLPPGTVFYLKEPLANEAVPMWNLQGMRGFGCFLRCDCPSDVIVVDERHELWKQPAWRQRINLVDPVFQFPIPFSPPSWFHRGNEFFDSQQYELAIRCFLQTLAGLNQMRPEDRPSLEFEVNLRLAKSYYHRGFYEKSLELLSPYLVEEPSQTSKICHFIASKCCYQLKDYKTSLNYAQFAQGPESPVPGIDEWLDRCKKSVAEEEKGNFEMFMFYSEQAHQSEEFDEIAEYTGPVEIVQIQGKGLCVVATRDMEPGTWVMVSKALAWLPQNSRRDVDMDGSDQLVAQLAQKIFKNPKTYGERIYSISNGKSSTEGPTLQVFCDPETQKEPIVDVEKLQALVENGVFGVNNSKTNTEVPFRCTFKESVSLFEKNVYFNHSCLPNSSFQNFGKWLFIRTIQFVKKGEELYLPYYSWKYSYFYRCEKSKQHRSPCVCRLCELDKAVDPKVHNERKRILAENASLVNTQALNMCKNPNTLVDQISCLIFRLNQTYCNRKQHLEFPGKLLMSVLYRSLSRVRSLQCTINLLNHEKYIKCLENVLKYLGFDPLTLLQTIDSGNFVFPRNALLDRSVMRSIADLVKIYSDLLNVQKTKKWFRILCAFEAIYSGGDQHVVHLKYKDTQHIHVA